MTIERSKIEELRTLYQDASCDWEINPKSHLEVIQKGSDAIELRPLVFGAGTHIKSRHNVELAVAMFEALPGLLDAYEEWDRLKAENEKLRNMIDAAIDPHHNTPHGTFESFLISKIDKLREDRKALSSNGGSDNG